MRTIDKKKAELAKLQKEIEELEKADTEARRQKLINEFCVKVVCPTCRGCGHEKYPTMGSDNMDVDWHEDVCFTCSGYG